MYKRNIIMKSIPIFKPFFTSAEPDNIQFQCLPVTNTSCTTAIHPTELVPASNTHTAGPLPAVSSCLIPKKSTPALWTDPSPAEYYHRVRCNYFSDVISYQTSDTECIW